MERRIAQSSPWKGGRGWSRLGWRGILLGRDPDVPYVPATGGEPHSFARALAARGERSVVGLQPLFRIRAITNAVEQQYSNTDISSTRVWLSRALAKFSTIQFPLPTFIYLLLIIVYLIVYPCFRTPYRLFAAYAYSRHHGHHVPCRTDRPRPLPDGGSEQRSSSLGWRG